MPSSKKNTTHTKHSRASKTSSASVKDVEEYSPSRAELLAALHTLPNPANPCLPPTMQYSNGYVAFRSAFNVIVGASEWAEATRSQDIISTATSPRWKAVKDSGAGKLWRDFAKLSRETCPPNEDSRARKRNREMEKKKALTSRNVLQTSPAPAANISLDTPSREPSSGKAPRTLSHPRHAPRAIAPSRPVVAPIDRLQIAPSAPRFDFSAFASPQSAFTNGWSPYGPSHPLFPFPTQCIDASSANYIMPVAFNLDSVPLSTPCVAPLSMPTSQVALQAPPPSAQGFSPLAFTDFSSGPDFAVSQLPVAKEPIPIQGGHSFQSPFVVVPSLPAGSSGAVAQAPSISSSPAPAYHPTPPLPVFYSARLQEPTLPQLSAASEFELLPQTFIENLLASASTQTTSGKTSFTALPAAEEEWDFFLPPTDWNAQALPQSPNANLLGLFDLHPAATAEP